VIRLVVILPALAACFGIAACASSSVAPAPSRGAGILVAVFAHPDDETIVAPALSHAARNGATVYVVIATDGRRGVSRHAGIPAGDSLAAVRAGEARCSAAALGARPPVLLGFEDAAKDLAKRFQLAVRNDAEKKITHTLSVHMPMTFDPAMLDQATPPITGKPSWAALPSADPR